MTVRLTTRSDGFMSGDFSDFLPQITAEVVNAMMNEDFIRKSSQLTSKKYRNSTPNPAKLHFADCKCIEILWNFRAKCAFARNFAEKLRKFSGLILRCFALQNEISRILRCFADFALRIHIPACPGMIEVP